MNSFIEKITEYLLKKQWVIFCLSILVGFGGYYLLPSDFVDKMPFSSRDWNVIACIVLLSIVAYLVFSLLRYLFSKVSAGRIRSKNRKYYARQDRAAEEENIEKYKSDIDRLSDRDYSILMYLLENENKKPFIQWGRMYGESILDSEEVFDSAPYQGTPPVIKDPISGVNLSPVADNPRQYLLKREHYERLKYIQQKTGSITHFERKRIDLEQ